MTTHFDFLGAPDAIAPARPIRRPPVARSTSVLAVMALCTSLCGQTLAAEPQTYALDPVHTRVMFSIDHAGFSRALGTISGSTGTLRFDPDDWTSAQLDVRVPMARLDLGDARWNAAALAGNLLNAKAFPQARFVSTTVRTRSVDAIQVCGELSLHGITRPLCMEVKVNAVKRYPLPPFRRTAGFSATATLDRSAFGIDAWPSLIGEQVELRIEAEAVRTGGQVADRLSPASVNPDAPLALPLPCQVPDAGAPTDPGAPADPCNFREPCASPDSGGAC